MSPEDKEQIEEMQEQISKYEKVLEETLSEKKTICKVAAGPLEYEGSNFFRVSSGGDGSSQMMFLWEDSPFGTKNMVSDIEIGSEVICLGSAIISIVPQELVIKKELPEFDLIDWSEIGGLDSQIKEIRDAIELPMSNAKLAEELGVPAIKGILMSGPPGCGKTLVAKAIASSILKSKKVDADAFVYVKGAELLSQYVGATEQKIASIFRNCREYSKRTGNQAVLFIDEAESIMPERGSMRSSDVDKTIVPTFLAEMDGLEGHNPIVLLSTNLPENLDKAIIREGRIDIKIKIGRPTIDDAKEIFKIHLSKVKIHDKLEDLVLLGADSIFACECKRSRSGAMIQTISQQASRVALSRIIAAGGKKSPKGITKEDLEESIKLINSSYVKV